MLRTIKLGEADRIVTIFTQGHGKVRAVAKGVRKTKSKFGARLEPTSRVALQCYRAASSTSSPRPRPSSRTACCARTTACSRTRCRCSKRSTRSRRNTSRIPRSTACSRARCARSAERRSRGRHARVLLEAAVARRLPPDARRLRPLRRARRAGRRTSWSRSTSRRAARCAGRARAAVVVRSRPRRSTCCAACSAVD